MDSDSLTITIHLVGALVAGGIIGMERSYQGRPAGFRTHALVCLASSLLMLVTLYQTKWLPGSYSDTVRMDPTRMAQGIMTGIGFLGAGVIFKEGLSVRGLTTAASIWITAAVGILIGIGFYFPAILGTLLTIGALSVFRRIEDRIPSFFYAHFAVRFDRQQAMPEAELRSLLAVHAFTVANMSYRLTEDGLCFEYRMVIRTNGRDNISQLAVDLRDRPHIRNYRISPTGD